MPEHVPSQALSHQDWLPEAGMGKKETGKLEGASAMICSWT